PIRIPIVYECITQSNREQCLRCVLIPRFSNHCSTYTMHINPPRHGLWGNHSLPTHHSLHNAFPFTRIFQQPRHKMTITGEKRKRQSNDSDSSSSRKQKKNKPKTLQQLAPKAGLHYDTLSKGHPLLSSQCVCDAINALRCAHSNHNRRFKLTRAQIDASLSELFAAGRRHIFAADMTPFVFWEKVGNSVGWSKNLETQVVVTLVFKLLKARKLYTERGGPWSLSEEKKNKGKVGSTIQAIGRFLDSVREHHGDNTLLMSFYENPSLALDTDDEGEESAEEMDRYQKTKTRGSSKNAGELKDGTTGRSLTGIASACQSARATGASQAVQESAEAVKMPRANDGLVLDGWNSIISAAGLPIRLRSDLAA
ncbi:uncharacterized protein BCR38DRAFT_183386, partial [Pseudomassariella vexata]